jgi:hypothetical protein
MGKNEKTPVKINDKEYFVEDMTDRQKALLNHVNDLNRKLSNAQFNIDQLVFGRDAFWAELVKEVESKPEPSESTGADEEAPKES